MEEEKKVSEETKVKMPNPNPYKKDRGEEDAEVEASNEGLETLNVALQAFGQNLPQQENNDSNPPNDSDNSDEDDTVDGEYKEV